MQQELRGRTDTRVRDKKTQFGTCSHLWGGVSLSPGRQQQPASERPAPMWHKKAARGGRWLQTSITGNQVPSSPWVPTSTPIPFWSPWQCSHPNHLWVVGMLTCAASDVRGEGAVGSSYCPDPNKVASSRCQLCQGDIGAVLPCCQVPCWCRRALLVHAEQVSIPLPRRGLPVHSQSPGSADGACRQGKRR